MFYIFFYNFKYHEVVQENFKAIFQRGQIKLLLVINYVLRRQLTTSKKPVVFEIAAFGNDVNKPAVAFAPTILRTPPS